MRGSTGSIGTGGSCAMSIAAAERQPASCRAGAAAPYFYGGDQGSTRRVCWRRHRGRGREARSLEGLPGTRLDPYRAVETGRSGPPTRTALGPVNAIRTTRGASRGSPRLDCADIDGPVRVIGVDIHRFDGDGDSWACE